MQMEGKNKGTSWKEHKNGSKCEREDEKDSRNEKENKRDCKSKNDAFVFINLFIFLWFSYLFPVQIITDDNINSPLQF